MTSWQRTRNAKPPGSVVRAWLGYLVYICRGTAALLFGEEPIPYQPQTESAVDDARRVKYNLSTLLTSFAIGATQGPSLR
jgi:hypothetical protein